MTIYDFSNFVWNTVLAQNLSGGQVRPNFRYYLIIIQFVAGIKNPINTNFIKFLKISCKKYACATEISVFLNKGGS